MSVYMSFLMTGLITFVNVGWVENFIALWWRAFYIAWPIAFLLVFLGAAPIRRSSEKIVNWLK
ncbi:hypothetical protein CWE09_06350 [Aliidiomarina minuta]|uniref:DUF2798 domain-containing protein n=1 Tax=Aliidiomarina minuta TaxID=880057 RepID=A0A432W8H7_9GAMM|nr:hypothetical protein CWE09_06350 [Aliidiomarina minuta]